VARRNRRSRGAPGPRRRGRRRGVPTLVNGNPAIVLHVDGEIDGVLAARVEDDRITGLYFVRNPQKLTRVGSETPLTLA